MRIELVCGDITRQKVDAIINSAGPSLLGGGGVDGAIHRAAGPELLQACQSLRETSHPYGLQTGDAVATRAGRLDAQWVIHVLGPVFSSTEDRQELLVSAYQNALALAHDLGAHSVAFPLISAGVYGWPIEEALICALDTLNAYDTPPPGVARLVVLDPSTFVTACLLSM